MAGALPLDDEPQLALPDFDPFAPPAPKQAGVGASDYARAALSGTYGLAKDVAAAGQYVGGAEESSGLAAARRWAEQGSKETVQAMSPAGQKAMSASVNPWSDGPTIYDKDISTTHALGLKVASSVPSLVASLLPGGLIGRVALRAGASAAAAGAAATVGGSTAAGVQTGGDVFADIQQAVLDTPDDKLQQENQIYRGLRDMGLDETQAKRKIVDQAAEYKPLVMAGITALTSKYGVEGMLGHGVKGGLARRVGVGMVGEASQEGVENFSQELLTQQGAFDAKGVQGEFNLAKAWEQALEGAVVGGITGGAVAGVRKAHPADGRQATVDPDIAAATSDPVDDSAAAPVAPAVTPPGQPAPQADVSVEADQTIEGGLASAGAELDRTATMLANPASTVAGSRIEPAVPGATAPVPGTGDAAVAAAEASPAAPSVAAPVDVDVAAALNPAVNEFGEEDPDAGVEEDHTPPPVPVVSPVAPEMAQAITEPVQPQEAPPVTPVAPEPQTAAVLPSQPQETPIPEVTPEVTSPAPEVSPPMSPIQQRVAELEAAPLDEAVKVTPEGKRVLRSGDEIKAARAAEIEAAKKARTTPRMSQAEAKRVVDGAPNVGLSKDESTFASPADYKTVFRRLDQILAAADVMGKPVPKVWADIAAVRPKIQGAQAAKNRPLYIEARRALAAATAEPTEVVRGSAAVRQEAKTKADKEAVDKVKQILKEHEYGNDIVRADNVPAMRSYINDLVGRAESDGVPTNRRGNADDHLLHMANARALANGKGYAPQVRDFMVNDMALRAGSEGFIREQRQAQAQKQNASFNEETDTRSTENAAEGTLSVSDTAAQVAEAVEEAVLARPRDRAPVHVSGDAYTVVTPQARKVEVARAGERQRLAVTPKVNAPVKITSGADLKAAIAARQSGGTEPTPAQAAAGNYPKTKLKYAGFPLSVETPRGTFRRGEAPDGTRWEVRMPAHYGYIRNTTGADGDHVDVYIGQNPDSPRVFVVDQLDADTKAFDEHKVLIGFNNEADALATYRKGFSDGRADERVGGVTMMSKEQFRKWVESPQRKAVAGNADAVLAGINAELAQDTSVPDTEHEAALELQDMRVGENQRVLASMDEDADLDAIIRQMERRDRKVQGSETTTTVGALLSKGGPLPSGEIGGPMSIDIVGRLRKLVKNVNVRVVDEATMLDVYAEEMARTGEDRLPRGYYDPTTDTIVLRQDVMDDPERGARLVIHEALHAAYSHALDARDDVKAHVDSLIADVRVHLAKEAQARGETSFVAPYGLTNAHEFISEIWSNDAFQQLAAQVEASADSARQGSAYKRNPISVWGSLLAKVKNVIFGGGGPKISVLEQAIRATQALDEGANRVAAGGSVLPALSRGPTMDVAAVLADKGTGFQLGWRKFGLTVGTLDQIRQQFAGLFPTAKGDALERVQVALQRADVEAKALAAEGHKFAEQFEVMRRKDAKRTAALAELMIDATMANVNLGPGAANAHLGTDKASAYQAKAQLPGLNARYDRLSAQEKAFFNDAARYYRDNQNQQARSLATQTLSILHSSLTEAERNDIVERVVTGKLTEDDQKKINNETIFKSLKDASAMKLVDGVYFPLMRHGDFVVRTTDEVGETFGGVIDKEASDDKHAVIEWRADKDKDARRQYKEFAEKTGLTITSVGKVRYLKGNGARVSMTEATGKDHVIAYRARVQLQGTHFFDSGSQAAAFIREMKPTFGDRIDPKPLQRADLETSGALTNRQLAAIQASLSSRTDISESDKKLMSGALMQASVRLMSGNRIQQRSLPRRGVYGASTDMSRNMLQYANGAGQFLAKMKHMPEVREALKDMRGLISSTGKAAENQARGQVLSELTKRIDKNVLDTKAPSKVVQDIMALSFLDKLFSPAYSMINGMQPWMVTAPILGARHGNMRAGLVMTAAYNTVGGRAVIQSGIANTARATRHIGAVGLDTTDVVASIRKNLEKAKDGTQLTELHDMLVSRGVIDQNAGMEIAGAISSGRGRWGTGLAKVDRIARQLPVAVEAINRSVTAVAAYRLARADKMSHEQAMSYAFDQVQNTQGDYSSVNQPRFFSNPMLRPAMQFKKYAQMMSYVMVDMTGKAFGPNTPRRERVQAFKQIGNVVLVQVAMAGAMGLPGLELLKVGAMLASALGIGSGYDDWERKARALFDRSFGKEWGQLISRGVISRALGVDLSTRLSLADMWTFGTPKSSDRDGTSAYLTQFILGAPGGLMLDWVDGLKDAVDGNYGKAAIKLIPNKFVSDVGKAVRGTSREEMTMKEAALQAVGFRSARLAEKGEETGNKIAASKDRSATKKELTQRYIEATTQRELLDAKVAIAKHNKAPGTTLTQKVFPSSLDRIRKEREAERRAVRG